jgi:hypothetical protein
MPNDFQKWLISQGYNRKSTSLLWMKNGELVSGKKLRQKLNEFKGK